MNNRLYRSKNNRVFLGLCGGLGEFFGINPLAFRLIFLFTGPGLIAYFILCAFVPEQPL
ncbi:MAG: PspC domain-containing protein [Clostridia bacterium]|nr:PspC domain-containing protein [Clostridia bacterium]